MSSSSIITIREIRVLSGLSRGAALPLDTPFYIGSSSECDLFLTDSTVADRHLMLESNEDGAISVQDLTDPRAIPSLILESTVFRAGDVELIWCASDKSWEASSEPPAAVDLDQKMDERLAQSRAQKPRTRKLALVGLMLGALVALMTIASFYSASGAKPRPVPAAGTRNLTAPNRTNASEVRDMKVAIEHTLDAKAFSQLTVSNRDKGLVITGHIRTDQQPELETLIRSWRKQSPLVRIDLQLSESAALSLPFEIVAMVGGPSPLVMTSTGQSLFPGSESDGFRLVLFNGACITFERIDTHQRLKQCVDHSSPPH